MRRGRKQKRDYFGDVTPQARQAIGAVLALVVGVFLALAAFDRAGIAGVYTRSALRALFGMGFFLAPIACGLVAVLLLRPREDERVSVSRTVGIGLFFLATLGLLSLYENDWGGIAGMALAWPLSRLLGPAAAVALGALLAIGAFLALNAGLALPRLRVPLLTTGLVFVAVFGWLMPYLATWAPTED